MPVKPRKLKICMGQPYNQKTDADRKYYVYEKGLFFWGDCLGDFYTLDGAKKFVNELMGFPVFIEV